MGISYIITTAALAKSAVLKLPSPHRGAAELQLVVPGVEGGVRPPGLKRPGRCHPICGQGMLLDLIERLPIVAASVTAPGGQAVGAAGG